MKRSNLFLAATTGLLAIASFAFAKSHSAKVSFTGYCLTANKAHCPTVTVSQQFALTDANNLKAHCQSAGNTSKTVVTIACIKKLSRSGD